MIALSTVLITAIVIEFLTLVLRFKFKRKAKDTHNKVMKQLGLKQMFHFHHLFLGILIAIVFYAFGVKFLFNMGLGVMASDIIHHFIVLLIITGDHEFNLFYKSSDSKHL
jgi:hypothetical protein